MAHALSSLNVSLYRYLRNASDSHDMIGSYSTGSPGLFYLTNDEQVPWVFPRIIPFLQDGANFAATGFGALSTLTNGLRMFLTDGDFTAYTYTDVALDALVDAGTILDYTDKEPIKTNGDFAGLFFDIDLQEYGAGEELLKGRLLFEGSGYPLAIFPGESLVVAVRDDTSALTDFEMQLQGKRLSSLNTLARLL